MNHHQRVTIPKSKLRAQLDEAEAIKREMTAMLRELEAKTPTRPAHAKPHSWRHHPAAWTTR